MNKKILLAIILSLTIFTLGVAIGSVYIHPFEIADILISNILNTENASTSMNENLIMNIRLPRVFIVFLIGGALGVSGTVTQSILQNPLASPYGLGMSAGAGLGITLLIINGVTDSIFGILLMPVTALIFGLTSVILIITVSQKIDNNLSNYSLILTGMVFSLFINSIMTTISSMYPAHLPKIVLWQSGNFSVKEWWVIYTFAIVLIICFFGFYNFKTELDIMSLGEKQASSIGVNTKKNKWILILIISILTSTSVAFVGIIGFVDLIAPHIVRKYFGMEHKYVLPMSVLFGGSFMVFCDIISRTIATPSIVPIGSVTAMLGTPFFIIVYLKNKGK